MADLEAGLGIIIDSGVISVDITELVLNIPSIKTGSFKMSQTAQTRSIDIGFKPTNALVFYSESETTTSARGVFGWARTDLFFWCCGLRENCVHHQNYLVWVYDWQRQRISHFH